MLYLPESKYLENFKLLAWALPQGLLPWLCRRGLGIYVLPPYEAAAKKILYGRLHVKSESLGEDDDRLAHQTAHYRSKEKVIVLPYTHFLGPHSANTFLHEVGHAVDFLYSDNHMFNEYKVVREALEAQKPFTDYCRNKDKISGKPLEQFATGFAGFFQEAMQGAVFPSIGALNPKLVSIIKNHLVGPFKDKNGT